MGEAKSWERAGAVSGLVAAVTFVVSFGFLPGNLVPASPANDVTSAYHDHVVAAQWSVVFLLLFTLIFAIFSAYLWSRFRAPDPTGGALALLVVMAGLLTVVVTVVQACTVIALTVSPSLSGDVGQLGVNDVSQVLYLAMMLGFLGFLGAIAVAGLATKRLHLVLSWIAAALAVLMAIFEVWAVFNAASKNLGGYGGLLFVAFALWLLATSIVLMLQSRRRPSSESVPAAAATN